MKPRPVYLPTLALVIAALAAVAACGSTPAPITAQGTIQVSINELANIASPGSATNPFQNGGTVTVISGTGAVLAEGPITPAANVGAAEGSTAVLNFQFKLSVPGGQPRYGVELSGVPGVIWETPQQMQHPALSVTVGS
jgi:hypothetical protein